MENGQSKQHLDAVLLLARSMQQRGYELKGVDAPNYITPPVVENTNRVGDGEDKQPDILAFDNVNQRYIRGEIKIGPEINDDHSITQFKMFSNRHNTSNNIDSLLIIGIPSEYVNRLKIVLNQQGINVNNIEIFNY